MKRPAFSLAARIVLLLLAAALPARAQTARFRTLHSFSATSSNGTNTEGAAPQAGLLIGPDGNFYGTAQLGGANGGGTVFRCTPNGTVSVLHPFTSASSGESNSDGSEPVAALIQDADGNLYGTASSGGINGAGTAFEVTLAGGFTPLYEFDSDANEADGSEPRGSLILTPDGALVGTAADGGNSNNNGTLFFLNGTTFGPALDFGGSLGTLPVGSLVIDQPPGAQFATLFGACKYGGNTGDPNGIGSGVIYGLAGAMSEGSLQPVYTFSALDSNFENPDGAQPAGGVIAGSDGNLYGTTDDGGPSGNGTVWQIVVDPDTGGSSLTVLHVFAGNDGSDSQAPLVQGSDGSFYGTTEFGGAAGSGVVFRVTTAKAYTVLHSFSARDNNGANSDGAISDAGLVEVRPGSFVGTASGGGANGRGTIFEVDVPPVITSAAMATGNAGSAFSYQITAVDSPGSFSVGGLGDGLTFNNRTGQIAGTPTAAGTLHLSVAATNDAGTGSQPLTVTIKGPVPVINSPATATAQVGAAFSYQITATNSPTQYGVGGLRPGLSVNKQTGAITGTPQSAGTFTLTLQAANANGTATKPLTLTVKPAAPTITSANTASATVGQPFSYQITATGSPTSFGVGGLFKGITVNAQTGLLTGTPTAAGTHSLDLRAANAGGTGHETLTLTVKAD